MSDPGPRPLRVTIGDIAAEAGVSRATAARALHGRGRFAAATRENILGISARLGYVPNLNAAELAAGRTSTVGLLLRDASNPAYGLLFSKLQEEAHARKMDLVTVTIGEDSGGTRQLAALQRLLGMRVAGLIVATGGVLSEQLAPFVDEVPILRAGRPETGDRIHAVSYDEESHGIQLAEHIFALGHRNIAVLATDPKKSFPEHVRANAMRAWLVANGARVVMLAVGGPADSGIAEAVALAFDGDVTAVMCPSDYRQLEFLRAAQQAGLAVPGQVSVTGCDGVLPGIDLLGLTTVRIPVEGVARAVVDQMQRLLEAENGVPTVREVVAGELIPGRTAAQPATAGGTARTTGSIDQTLEETE